VKFRKPKLRFALDEGVPNSVDRIIKARGHSVAYLNEGTYIPRGSKDTLVCAFAVVNNFILVAMDGDMKAIAKGHGVSKTDYAKLNLLKISCHETDAAARVEASMTLIEHEWYVNSGAPARRLFVEIMKTVIRTNR